MKIIFWGTPEYSVNSLNILNKSEHEIIAVISQPDKKRSRGKKLIPTPVKKYSLDEKLQILTPKFIKGNTEFINKLKNLSCDLFIVVAYGKILPKEILEIPKYGCWNAHASLLPRWRGAAPIQWSLLEGDKFTGVGIMRMEEGLDTGDVLLEEKIKIDLDDNLISLTEKLSLLSAKLLIRAITILVKNIENNINLTLTKQNTLNREIKYARMINKSDYELNWGNDANNIFRTIKALFPRANTKFRGKNLKIIKIRILKNEEIKNNTFNIILDNSEPGTILGKAENEGILISTKTQPIILLEAKLEGKNISTKNQLIQQLKPIVGENLLA